MELVKSFKISSFFLGRWLKGGVIGPSDIWTVSASASKTPRFPVVGYDKHLAVIRRNMESPIGWPYYHNSVMGDGNLTDLRGRVSALDIQDNLETNEKKKTRSQKWSDIGLDFFLARQHLVQKSQYYCTQMKRRKNVNYLKSTCIYFWNATFAKNTIILDQQNTNQNQQ